MSARRLGPVLAGPLAGALLLAGCASTPPPVRSVPAALSERTAVRLQALNAAVELERAGRMRDALWRLRIAEAADPSDGEASSRIARLQARIAGAAEDLAAQGAGLERRGDLSRARERYAAALALEPAQVQARLRLERLDTAPVLAAVSRSEAGGPKSSPRGYAKARRTAARRNSKSAGARG